MAEKQYVKWLLEMPQAPENWNRLGDKAHYLRALLNLNNATCKEEWKLTISYVQAKLLNGNCYDLVQFLYGLPDYYEDHIAKPNLLKWALTVKGWI